MTSARSSCASDWRQRIGRRLRTVPITKASGTTLGIGAFFVAYFWTLHHPLFAVITMPLTAPDRWIGFVPQALPLYASLWLYVSLAPALLADRRELLSFGLGALVLSLVGLGMIGLGRGSMKYALPFGCFLAIGAALAAVAGQPVLDWYLGFF